MRRGRAGACNVPAAPEPRTGRTKASPLGQRRAPRRRPSREEGRSGSPVPEPLLCLRTCVWRAAGVGGQGRGERRWDSSEPPGRPVAPVTARALRGAGRRGGARGPPGFGTAAGARGPGLRVPRLCRRGVRTPGSPAAGGGLRRVRGARSELLALGGASSSPDGAPAP